MSASEGLFWAGVAVVTYVYAGYPVIMSALAHLFPRAVRKGRLTPTVSVLIAAHNEESQIAAKLENCLMLSYPKDRLEVIVVSDGSTDRTVDIVSDYVRRCADRIRLIEVPVRRGKPHALNAGAAVARGEVLLLADVRQRFEPTVVAALVSNFADSTVGAVSGELMLAAPGAAEARDGLGLYWRYEKDLRVAESRVRSAIHYTGAVTAIRRRLFEPLPLHTLHDDVVMPLRLAARGVRVVFEPEARAYETAPAAPARELYRKMRTQAATLQTLLHLGEFVGPLGVFVWWQFVSHTVLRLVVPYALGVLFVSSALIDHPFYRSVFVAQCLFYALAVVGARRSRSRLAGRLLSVPSMFVTMNLAALLGPLFYLSGHGRDLWTVSREEASHA